MCIRMLLKFMHKPELNFIIFLHLIRNGRLILIIGWYAIFNLDVLLGLALAASNTGKMIL